VKPTREALIDALRTHFARPEARAWVGVAVLFGSFARGEANEHSDVDVGILPGSHLPSLAEELALEDALSRAVGREVDLVRLDDADTILRRRVAHEGVVLAEETRGAFARFAAAAALDYLDIEPLLVEGRKRYLRRVGGGS
jgi:predicted nucleotidyltransferase